METMDKSGKVKFTFEVEINQPAMDMIKQNIDMTSELLSQAVDNWREEMARRRKEGKGMGMGMGHGMLMHGGP